MTAAEQKNNGKDQTIAKLREQVAQRDKAILELKQKVIDGMEAELDARRRLESARDAVTNLATQVQQLQQKQGPRAVGEVEPFPPGEDSTSEDDNNSKGSRAGHKEGGS